MQKKIDLLLILLILSVALLFRLYKINTPLADFHSWRQVDTAAVANNFVKGSFDLLHPKYDDLSNIQSGKENPEGYRMVEFPIYNAIFASLYKLFPLVPLEIYGRLTSIFFSLIIIFCLYYFCLKEISRVAAVASSLIYAVFPFFVFFSRVVLPETPALGFAILSIFLLYLWQSNKNKYLNIVLFILSLVSFSCSILIKPTVIFFALPLVYLFTLKYKFGFIKKPGLYLFFILSLIPLFIWRDYILKYPEGIPASEWLITSVNTYEGLKNIFFRPAFFRWLFFERINNLILGGYLTFFFILGVFTKTKKYFFHSIFLASLLYLLVFQGGNVQHEYYQTLILPSLAIGCGLGISFLISNKKFFLPLTFLTTLILILAAFSFFFSYYRVKDYYNYSKDLLQTANIINTLTLPTDLIVTDTIGDTTLLYLSHRRGSPAVYKDLDSLKETGYRYFFTDKSDVINDLKLNKAYSVVFENDKFALFKL